MNIIHDLIRTRTWKDNGMFVTAIDGLNFLVANQRRGDVREDPQVAFMRAITDVASSTIHIGTIALEGVPAGEYFTTDTLSRKHLPTPVGFYGNSFYTNDRVNGYMFFNVGPLFWETQVDSTGNGLDYVIQCDALAIYVGGASDAEARIEALVNDPISGPMPDSPARVTHLDDWLPRITDICDYCVITASDGWNTLIYSRHGIDPEFVQRGIAAATQKIIASEWYATHQSELVWEDDFTRCFVMPEIKRYYEEVRKRFDEQEKKQNLP